MATNIRLAARMRRLGTESAFEVLARARALEAEGRSIIHLEISEPDFDTPEHIREAAKAALDAGHTHTYRHPGSCRCGRRSRPSWSGRGGCAPALTG